MKSKPSNITRQLSGLKANHKKAFIPFITAGYPNIKVTERLIYSLEKSGASLIELGMPFSDPMADGPVIQKANEVALKKGINLKDILNLVKKVRQNTQIPILLMGYYNPIYQYGLKKFANDAHKAGVDGLLIVDLPVEEAGELRTALQNKPIDLVYLLTPTSTPSRIKLVNKYGAGFVYYVSYTGITGASRLNPKALKTRLTKLKKQVKHPLNIGFGISTPQHVKQLAPLADGVIVGSALIKLIEKHGSSKELYPKIESYVRSMVKSL